MKGLTFTSTSSQRWLSLFTRQLSRASKSALPLMALLFATALSTSANAQDTRSTTYAQLAFKECPQNWVPSTAPGGCSPGFFTLEQAGLRDTEGCPTGWVPSTAPGGCSPGFFTLRLNGERDSRQSCPDGWVRSSAPGGCSPGYITLAQAQLIAIDECPDGWVRSSAPGGCSPGNFTLETGFDGLDRARFNCAFGKACDTMIEAIKALGGSCESDGPDTSCDLPPLIDED